MAESVAVASSGEVAFGGSSRGAIDFGLGEPPEAGGFAMKLDAHGQTEWAHHIEPNSRANRSGWNSVTAVAIDEPGQVYAAGVGIAAFDSTGGRSWGLPSIVADIVVSPKGGLVSLAAYPWPVIQSTSDLGTLEISLSAMIGKADVQATR